MNTCYNQCHHFARAGSMIHACSKPITFAIADQCDHMLMLMLTTWSRALISFAAA